MKWAALEKRFRVSKSTIEHELQVLDIRAALTAAISKTSAQVVEFCTWPALYEFTARRNDGIRITNGLVKPDGYFHISEQKQGAKHDRIFFLEVDRSTEMQDTLALKSASYTAYYKDGGYAGWLGKPRADFRDYPFCVLMVLKNAERRNNTAERLLQLNPPIRRQVWLTTLKEIISDPLGAIWVQPGEYLEVTKGTAFDPRTKRQKGMYQRQVGRERFVEQSLTRKRLMEV